MICTKCYQSFEGIGVICPSCEQSDAQQALLRSAHTERMRSESLEVDDFSTRPEERAMYIPLAERPARALAFFSEALFTLPVVGISVIVALQQLGDADGYLLRKLFFEGPNSLVPSAKEILLPAIIWFQITFAVLIVLYYTAFEASPLRATPGKLLLGLMVSDAHGDEPGILRLFLRNAFRFILLFPAVIYIVLQVRAHAATCSPSECQELYWNNALISLAFVVILPLVSYCFYFSSRTHQGLHDILPSTYVTRVHHVSPTHISVALLAGVLGMICWGVPFVWMALIGH